MGLFNFFKKKSQVENSFEGEQGLFIDHRDNNEYRWLRIKDKLWMIDNLRYLGDSGVTPYEKKKSNIANFGYLYTRTAAVECCPDGWEIPTYEDFESLIEDYGYHELFDDKFLNFKLGGRYWDDGESHEYTSINSNAYYWSSTVEENYVYYLQVFGPSSVKINYTWDRFLKERMACSVRCVRNA